MSNNWPVGMPKDVQGAGNPWPQTFDPTINVPRTLISLSAAGSFPIARGCWIEVSGVIGSGWTFQPEGASGPTLPLVAGACFPAPKDGVLIVNAAGSGVPVLIVWPPHLGVQIAQGRGYAPPGSMTGGSLSPKASPTQFTTGGLKTPAIAGTNLSGVVTVPTALVVITDQANASPIYFAETQAKAALLGAAGGGQPLYAAGADVFPLPVGGSLWAASVDAAQLCYIRSEVAT